MAGSEIEMGSNRFKRYFFSGAFVLLFVSLILLLCSAGPTKGLDLKNAPIDLAVTDLAKQLGRAYSSIAAHVRPAVVSVFSEKVIKRQWRGAPFPFSDDLFKEFFDNFRERSHSYEYNIPQLGMGSGVLLDRQGNILTNFHVVQNVDEIKVQFANQKKIKAKLVGKDERTDIAVIRVSTHGLENYPAITMGDSDAVQVGDVVLAIGAPFGLEQTVTHGIISAKGRSDVGLADYEDFLQTDAPINPGNSGGPLVNTRGEIIGINSAIATNLGQSGGVGFAIPSNMIKDMLPKLIKGEAIIRGELGIGIQNLNEDLAESLGVRDAKGVLVTEVYPNSAAERAGIAVEDVITHYNEKATEDVRTLRNYVAASTPGSSVKITLLRDKQKKEIVAVIGQQKRTSVSSKIKSKESTSTLKRLGFTVENLSKELALQFNIRQTAGVVIVNVEDASVASIAGLQVGDLIVQANRKKVRNVDDFYKIISSVKKEMILLRIKRQEMSIFVSMRIE